MTTPRSLVVLFGPPAVGKMTVGLELERLTGLPLFHNHMSVDPILRYFDFGTPAFGRLVGGFRQRLFEEVAASELPGLIFTYVWALNDPSDRANVDQLTSIFTAQNARICFVELQATQAERLVRNQTPLRLQQKAPKRDIARSRQTPAPNDVVALSTAAVSERSRRATGESGCGQSSNGRQRRQGIGVARGDYSESKWLALPTRALRH